MLAFDLENNNSFELSQLDVYRIEDLEINDKMSGECGNFDVVRKKDGYILFILHEGLIRKKKLMSRNFKTLKELIRFLKK